MTQENQNRDNEQLYLTTQSVEKPRSSTRMLHSREYIFLFICAGLIIFLDQWTKSQVVNNIPFMHTWLPENLGWLEPYARIVHWHNSGAAFGLFQNGSLIFTVLAFIASIFILLYYPQVEKDEWFLKAAMLLQLGGALGNLVDRIKFGYVIDFISIGNFPVFNVADSSISVGVAILLIGIFLQDIKERKTVSVSVLNVDDANSAKEEYEP